MLSGSVESPLGLGLNTDEIPSLIILFKEAKLVFSVPWLRFLKAFIIIESGYLLLPKTKLINLTNVGPLITLSLPI
ncbi:Uncharacterised protein [Chlamydia abortus]|nr:Uncharacterised protein [Chlamydia abortus]